MRARLASRSIAWGLGLPGPTNPWTAETTVVQPCTAAVTAAGSRRSPVRTCTDSGRCAARAGSRVSTRTRSPRPTRGAGDPPPRLPPLEEEPDHLAAERAGPAGHQDHEFAPVVSAPAV